MAKLAIIRIIIVSIYKSLIIKALVYIRKPYIKTLI